MNSKNKIWEIIHLVFLKKEKYKSKKKIINLANRLKAYNKTFF